MVVFNEGMVADPATRCSLCLRFYDDAPAESRRILAQSFTVNPSLSCGVAYRWLSCPANTRSSAARFLARLIVEEGHLASFLTNLESATFQEALLLAETITSVVPGLEISLLDGFLSGDLEARAPAQIHRILEIVTHVDKIGRSNGQLVRFLRHPDSRIRSKAVQLILRATESVDTALSLLNDTDDRVCANALESLWHRASNSNTQQLFRQYTGHPAHRVATNALVGLSLSGDESAMEELTRRARSADPPIRHAAIWAMGYLALPQFEPVLRGLLKSPEDAGIRGTVLRALVSLRRSDPLNLPFGESEELCSSPALDALAHGREYWNQWRAAGGDPMPDLSRVSLRDRNLTGYDLGFVSFRDSDLSNAKLNLANLFGADLSGANASGADFRHADLRAVTLDAETRFPRASFGGAALYGLRFIGNDLRGATFDGADLTAAEFVNCRHTGIAEPLAVGA